MASGPESPPTGMNPAATTADDASPLADLARRADRMTFGPQLPRRLDVRALGCAAILGLLTGLFATAYRHALGAAIRVHDLAVARQAPRGLPGWLALAAMAAAAGAAARLIVARLAPETAGSGIPAVEARLQADPPMRWRRILPVKFFGGLASLVTGMSVGREGPTVQLGAALGEAVAEHGADSMRLRKALVAAGAGAGLTGAFNAPIAGLLFVVEELRWEMTPLTYLTAFVASLCCQLVVGLAFGNTPLLGQVNPPPVETSGLALALLCGIAAGLAGVLYNRAILGALDVFDSWAHIPGWAKGAAAALLAVGVAWFLPAALFGNDAVVQRLVHGRVAGLDPGVRHAGLDLLREIGPEGYLFALAATKLLLTAASYASGVVGGLFAPQLVIGGAVGGLIGELAQPFLPGVPIIAILVSAGAVGTFTASVRAPLTGIVLLLEMTGATNQVFPFSISAATAFLVATALGEKPIYEALGARVVKSAAATEASGAPASPA